MRSVVIVEKLQHVKRPSFIAIGIQRAQMPTSPHLRDQFACSRPHVWVVRPIHSIFLCVITHIMLDVIMVKPNPMLHNIGKTIKHCCTHLYIGEGLPCLLVPPLALHKVRVLTCIAQHLLQRCKAILARANITLGNVFLTPMWFVSLLAPHNSTSSLALVR